MTRQPNRTLVPRVEPLEERCVPTVVSQPAANNLLVTTGSTHLAMHEMATGGTSFVLVSGAGRSGPMALPLSGPFQIGVSFTSDGMHQIDFFHAPGTPGGTLLATVGSGPAMRTTTADVKIHGGVIHSALASGSPSGQVALDFLPVGGASPHSLTTVGVPAFGASVNGHLFAGDGLRHGVLVGVVLPVGPEFGLPTLSFAGAFPAGVWPYLGATPNPFDRGFVVPATVLPGLFFSSFFTEGAFVNPFFNPFDAPLA